MILTVEEVNLDELLASSSDDVLRIDLQGGIYLLASNDFLQQVGQISWWGCSTYEVSAKGLRPGSNIFQTGKWQSYATSERADAQVAVWKETLQKREGVTLSVEPTGLFLEQYRQFTVEQLLIALRLAKACNHFWGVILSRLELSEIDRSPKGIKALVEGVESEEENPILCPQWGDRDSIAFADHDLEWFIEPKGRTCITIKQRECFVFSVILSPLDPRQWVLEVEDLNWLEIMPKHVKTMRSLVLSVSEYIQVSELSKILEELTGDFGEEG